MPDLSKYRPQSQEHHWRTENAGPVREKRHSMEVILTELEDSLEQYDPTTIESLVREVEKARERVGDNPDAIANLLEETAKARTSIASNLRKDNLPIDEVIRVIRKSNKKPN